MSAKICIHSTNEAPSIAGDWIMERCRHAGLDQIPANRVRTCVVEAVNNCVEHAYRDTHGVIGIRLFTGTRWLVVQVRDQGKPIERQTPITDPDPLQIDGRGWYIMQQWMDIAQYRRRNHRNVVTLAKCLEK